MVITSELADMIKREEHIEILEYIKTHKMREPTLVIRHAFKTLGSNFSYSGLNDSQRLVILEQLLLASLDVQDLALAEKCLSAIRSTNGVPRESVRVRRLLGQCLESAGDMSQASNIYDDLLKENPANVVAMKRKCALLLMQPGKEVEARNALNAYVNYQQGDVGAWMKLYTTCMNIGDYKGATYALEEVLLAKPTDARIQCLLGETYGTLGGFRNLTLARKHLCLSLEFKPAEGGNLRALYSLVGVASAFIEELAQKNKKKDYEGEENLEVAKELIRYGAEKLACIYGKTSAVAKAVNKVMADELISI